MKLQMVVFSEPISLPGTRSEKVISMANPQQRAHFDLELDARGFCRVRVLKDNGAGVVAFVGPTFIKAAFAEAAELDKTAKR